MSPNGISSGFEEFFSSSESSEFDYFLQSDKNNGNISKQWEAIERTLYQEPGQQVTDPDLLKECKLWRETFPHFRVTGTKINVELPNDESYKPDKTVQTVQKHVSVKKVEEKRADLKKKIVDMLVERMIAKYGNDKHKFVKSTTADVPKSRNSVVSSDKESYYERGKVNDDGISKEEMEEKLYNIFDSWEKDAKKTVPKISERLAQPKKIKQSTIQPVEVANKIDKKYEGLIEKIMERKQTNPKQLRTTMGTKSYHETLEKLRKDSGYDDYIKHKTINRFNNNWLKRGERNLEDFLPDKTKNSKAPNKGDDIDESLLKELKEGKSLHQNYSEKINLRRPKPFTSAIVKSSKSSSCKDLTRVKNTGVKNRTQPVAGKSESDINKNMKTNKRRSQNTILPPIESGIICTEITGYPRMQMKNSIRK